MADVKRGKLSAIKMLPDEAIPHYQAARNALLENRRPAEDIRAELNEHLLALGVEPISRSAFNRHSLELAKEGDKILKARVVAEAYLCSVDKEQGADVGILINEMLKTAIYDVMIKRSFEDDDLAFKELSTAALALYRLESAKKFNVQSYAQRKDALKETAGDAIKTAGQEAGLSEEAIARIRRKVLGVIEQSDKQTDGSGGAAAPTHGDGP